MDPDPISIRPSLTLGLRSVSDSVNRGTSTAGRMQASLYDWIVYQRRYKARERKGEGEDGWWGGLVQISDEGRQGASGKRANGDVAEYGRSFSGILLSRDSRSTEFHRNSPPSSTSAVTFCTCTKTQLQSSFID